MPSARRLATNRPSRVALPSPESVLAAVEGVVQASGLSAWLVGGTVRDRLMGRPFSDMDVVIGSEDAGVVRSVASAVAGLCGLPWFTLSSEFGGERMVWGTGHLDLSPLRGPRIEDDLALRDFTVNAIAVPLGGGPPIDPCGGLSDIGSRRLRLVSPEAFRADPVRLLRAARFARTHGLAADTGLTSVARRDAHLVSSAAPERVLMEVMATLDVDGAPETARLWHDLGVLAVVFPEVAALEGVGQSTNHRHDVYGHTLEALDHVDGLLRDPTERFPEAAAAFSERIQQPVDGVATRRAALRLAVLLHDIAKPQTRHIDELGRLSFWGHEAEGAPMARQLCGRLRCSAALTGLVIKVVEGHLWLGFLQNRKPLWSHDEIGYLWLAHPWEPEVIAASVADRLATRGPMTADRFVWRPLTLARHLMWLWSERQRMGVPSLPLRGDELASLMGIEPGPNLGELLRALRLEWEAGELLNRAAVIERAHEIVGVGAPEPERAGPGVVS